MTLPRMYILGTSPLFLLISHEIAKLSQHPKSIPNLILLLSDPLKLKRFLSNDSRISIIGKNEPVFQYMTTCTPPTLVTEERVMIDNLVVVERNRHKLISDLNKYKESLSHNSSLLLINPPMGTFEMLRGDIWKETERDIMPKIFVGLTDNRNSIVKSNRASNDQHLILNPQPDLVKHNREFSVNLNPLYWNSKIPLLIAPFLLPAESSKVANSSTVLSELSKSNDLIKAMDKLGKFNTTLVQFTDFHFLRLERTIIDSCIESLAALYDCKYIYELLLVDGADRLLKSLVREQIHIILKSYPHLVESPNCNVILNEGRLLELIMMKLRDSKLKSKSFKDMNCLDIESINDLNSYFVGLGYKNDIHCKWTTMLKWLLKGKLTIKKENAIASTYM